LDTIERVLELGDKAAAVVGLVRVALCGSRRPNKEDLQEDEAEEQ
jgi:hypothetical protein